jgi:EAL domain-containing protein (putative c-di-GMP-specific phosphodiesterase class I)/ActR/RegA family two-component response regulator
VSTAESSGGSWSQLERGTTRVLLCTSDTSDLPLVAAALSMSREPIELHFAQGYAESELELERGDFEAVILDVELGDGKGLALLERGIERRPRRPIVAMLANPHEDVEHEAIRLGAADVLVRGEAQPGRIERAVRHALERCRKAAASVPPRQSLVVAKSSAEQRRDELIAALPAAFDRGELVLNYQPKVRTSDGGLVGAEALMRWTSPAFGSVSPLEFVPLLEETGMVSEAGAWAIAEGARQARRWREQGLEVRVAVNVSARQFINTDLASIVQDSITRENIPAQLLELELTESVLLETTEANRRKVAALREIGCLVAIDDFGTGFATLSYIKRFPMDVLKIDRTFVRGLPIDNENAAITSAIVALGRSLGIEVVAEGVESEIEHEFLRSLGCPVCQGYLFGTAMGADELVVWNRNRSRPNGDGRR